jgi:hypothetical protein
MGAFFFVDAVDGRVQLGTVSKPIHSEPAKTAGELAVAARWAVIEKLPPSEREAIANDIEKSRRKLQSPVRPVRRIEPKNLQEALSAQGSKCPIPFTHDRIHEVHHWWHEMARWYHEPTPFRYALGAFIQASRSVTYMLQKESAAFNDMDWYKKWRKFAESDPLLKWIHDTRNTFVHAEALQPHSWLKMTCVGVPPSWDDDGDGTLTFDVSPFQCTHYYLGPHRIFESAHTHEFERYWGIDSLPDKELLEVCAEIYDRLDDLVHEAHVRAGADFPLYRTPDSKHALPCMEDVLRHRTLRTVMENGREIFKEEPPAHPHQH